MYFTDLEPRTYLCTVWPLSSRAIRMLFQYPAALEAIWCWRQHGCAQLQAASRALGAGPVREKTALHRESNSVISSSIHHPTSHLGYHGSIHTVPRAIVPPKATLCHPRSAHSIQWCKFQRHSHALTKSRFSPSKAGTSPVIQRKACSYKWVQWTKYSR